MENDARYITDLTLNCIWISRGHIGNANSQDVQGGQVIKYSSWKSGDIVVSEFPDIRPVAEETGGGGFKGAGAI